MFVFEWLDQVEFKLLPRCCVLKNWQHEHHQDETSYKVQNCCNMLPGLRKGHKQFLVLILDGLSCYSKRIRGFVSCSRGSDNKMWHLHHCCMWAVTWPYHFSPWFANEMTNTKFVWNFQQFFFILKVFIEVLKKNKIVIMNQLTVNYPVLKNPLSKFKDCQNYNNSWKLLLCSVLC